MADSCSKVASVYCGQGNMNTLTATSLINDKLKNGRITSLKDISLHDVFSYVENVQQKSFSTPQLPEPFLAVSFSNEVHEFSAHENRTLVTADSEIMKARITAAKRLTRNDSSVKKTLELTLKLEDMEIEYKPGDVFGFLCSNPPEEVSYLLKRLEKLDVAVTSCKVSLLDRINSKKKIPAHIPSMSTLKHILSSCVDLRSVPKKVFLRILAEYSTDECDCRSLEFLSSREGASLFEECIQKQCVGILDILEVFRSCHPPVERLLEYLPLLRPRFYSVASSPLTSEDSFRVVFNVINEERKKYYITKWDGICTGWLDAITTDLQSELEADSVKRIESELSQLHIKDNFFPILNVPIYKRFNKNFFLPEDTSIPLIMVGPGTGIAPFIGFLQHREKQMSLACPEQVFGNTWLFYGCRHEDKDFLYRCELERMQSINALTHLFVCFSRDEVQNDKPRYVQDNIILHSQSLVTALDNGGIIYVCGDAKGMSKDIQNAFIEAFKVAKNYSENEAQSYFFELCRKKRYLMDLWK